MPRFGLSSPGLASPSSMPFGESSSQQQSPSASVQLSCLSPDGRAVYSLNANNRELETHTLPLAGTVQDMDVPSSIIIRTPLPDHVVSALRRYPAIELLCVDVDRDRGTTSLGMKRLPSLCLYSKKDVFLLEIGYTPSSSQLSGEVPGTCLSVSEPFDSILLGNMASINIIKIRQAPQQIHGYVTICPPEAMAMLTHDTTINEYSLTLYHGGTAARGSSFSSHSTPLVYGVEQLDEQLDRLTDFVFLQSTAFSLLSNLSVGFLKATGEVFQASPILFRGTVVPQETVSQSLDYLQSQMDKYDAATARGRQVRSARQYLVDCFQQANTRGRFVSGQERSPAFEWPAQMQGPVLLLPESSDDSECRAICMEIVPAGQLCGLAIGYDGYQVEFGLISPTLFIPRFQLENPQDTLALDQELKWGAIVTRVDLREDDEESDHHPSCPCMALVRDPIMETVVHYVTPTAIKSISTNALKVTANQLTSGNNNNSSNSSRMFSPNAKGRDVPIKTTGWSCLDVSTVDGVPKSVVGVVVSGDVQFGHVLVARLSNGTMTAINLTETRQIQEMEAISDMQNETLAIAARPDASHSKELQALHETPALADIAKPLMEKAIVGLRGMGKIVGSVTAVEQITPDMLAAAAHIKEHTDKEVLLPLIELHEHVRARKKEIVVMFNNQMSQLKSLREMVAKLKERESSIAEKLEVIRDNANSMAARSATVLQAAHDLQPTITQAEFDYFQELERLQVRAKQWQQQLDHVKVGASTLVDSIEKGTIVPFSEIPNDTHTNLVAMLHGCDTYIKNYTKRVKEQEICIDELAALAGWDRDPHGEVKLGQ